MPQLSNQHKLLIVLELARFKGPSEISRAFRDELGIEILPAQIGTYDPTRTYYEAGDNWRKVFEEERERYLTNVQAVPIANQGYRLNALQRTYDDAVKAKNRVLANQTLRQAAEEVGGALTNERNLKVTRPLDQLDPSEKRSMLADVFAKALEVKDPPGTQPAPEATQ